MTDRRTQRRNKIVASNQLQLASIISIINSARESRHGYWIAVQQCKCPWPLTLLCWSQRLQWLGNKMSSSTINLHSPLSLSLSPPCWQKLVCRVQIHMSSELSTAECTVQTRHEQQARASHWVRVRLVSGPGHNGPSVQQRNKET